MVHAQQRPFSCGRLRAGFIGWLHERTSDATPRPNPRHTCSLSLNPQHTLPSYRLPSSGKPLSPAKCWLTLRMGASRSASFSKVSLGMRYMRLKQLRSSRSSAWSSQSRRHGSWTDCRKAGCIICTVDAVAATATTVAAAITRTKESVLGAWVRRFCRRDGVDPARSPRFLRLSMVWEIAGKDPTPLTGSRVPRGAPEPCCRDTCENVQQLSKYRSLLLDCPTMNGWTF